MINVEYAEIFVLDVWSLLRPTVTGGRGNKEENTWKNREDDVRSGALV